MLENTKKLLLRFALLAVIFFVGIVTMLFNSDPFNSSKLVILFFYLFSVVFLTSFFSLIFFFLRIGSSRILEHEKMQIAIREGILLAILVTGSFFLSSKQLLYWWLEIIFVATVIFIEIFFLI